MLTPKLTDLENHTSHARTLPGPSPVSAKLIDAWFDGGSLSSNTGVLALGEVETRLGIADRLAGCLLDDRVAKRVKHSLTDIIRFRMMMTACGYEDSNVARSLRIDLAFKLACDRQSGAADLCSQPTISRLDNMADTKALIRMGGAMADRGGYRRHVRHLSWRPAIASVQRLQRSSWRVAQFDTLRLRLLKIAARFTELNTKTLSVCRHPVRCKPSSPWP